MKKILKTISLVILPLLLFLLGLFTSKALLEILFSPIHTPIYNLDVYGLAYSNRTFFNIRSIYFGLLCIISINLLIIVFIVRRQIVKKFLWSLYCFILIFALIAGSVGGYPSKQKNCTLCLNNIHYGRN
jgi:hypothetical protein